MSDPAVDRESEPVRGPPQADWRADYDDNFGRVRTPRQILRRQLMVPSIAVMLLGICGVEGACFVAFAAMGGILGFFDGEGNDLHLSLIESIILLPLSLTVCGLSVLLLIAGSGMATLQRHRLALLAAYFVTGLSLAGPFGLPFFPFGIWALVLLNKTEVRKEFDLPYDPAERVTIQLNNRRRWSEFEVSPVVLMVFSGPAFVTLLTLLIAVTADYVAGGDWQDAEFIWCVALALVGMAVFAGLFVRGCIRRRNRKRADMRASEADSEGVHV